MYHVGWFSSGRDKAASDLLSVAQASIKQGKIKAKISFVFSNREWGEAEESDSFFEVVRSYQIPLVCYSSRKFSIREEKQFSKRWRLEYDREIMRHLEGFYPDLCVLAGYMLIVGEEMCQKYPMINLHPAAPGGPAGTWQEVIWKLIENRASQTGVMMHLVTPELDKGPAATYCTFSIRGEPFDKYWEEIEEQPLEEVRRKEDEKNPLFRLIRQHGLMREFPLIIATLEAFSEGRVKVEAGGVVDAQGKSIEGYNLTQEIEKTIT